MSGQYLTVEFRDVIADALDLMDKHVTSNYSRLEKSDDWFWIMVASVVGVQLEIVWLVLQIVWKRRKERQARARETFGSTQEKPRV